MPEVDPALNGRFTHRHNVRSFLFGFAKDVATGLPVASLRERIAVVTQKPVLLTLLVTCGPQVRTTYLVVFLASEAGIDGAHAGPCCLCGALPLRSASRPAED